MRRTLIFTSLLVFIALSIPAQHVPGTRWLRRETGHFILIYPDTMREEASALAVVLDEVLKDSVTRLPADHSHRKWPLVLTNLGVESNGYVTLAPRQSVWYATPGEDVTAVSDWLLLLAQHEGRHMAQFDAADRGFTRALHVLFGEYGWGAGIVAGTPVWLLEGDAVAMETALSEEGRGRDPLFTQDMAAMVRERPEVSYYRAVNPSYKYHVPDSYQLGYALSSWIREEYGSDALEEIYRGASGFPVPVLALNTGARRATGKLPRELYAEMAAALAGELADLQVEGEWTQALTLSPEHDSFTRYDSLFASKDGVLFARRVTQADPAVLVRIADGVETELMRLPSRGRMTMAETTGGYRLVWNSLRPHPVFTGSSVSDLTLVDTDLRGRVVFRRTLLAGTRYLYPGLSPGGDRLALVEILPSGSADLVVLETLSGEEVARRHFERATPAYPSWSADSRFLVFSLRSDAGRKIAEWEIGTSEIADLSETTRLTLKKPVYSPEGESVYISSNETGGEAIWRIHRESKDRIPVMARSYGVSSPAISPDGRTLYAVEYASALGEIISRAAIDEKGAGEIPPPYPVLPRTFEKWKDEENPGAPERDSQFRDPANREAVVQEADRNYPESSYSPADHAFNLHSWGPGGRTGSAALLTSDLVLNIQSRDVLGVLSFEAGGLYETTEGSPGAYTALSFTGIRPVISVLGEYRYRSPTSDPFHQTTFAVSVMYPANLARSGIWNHSLNTGLIAGVLSQYPGGHYPYAGYLADWSRLRPGSDRAFRPDLGWQLQGSYFQLFEPGSYGDAASAQGRVYLPGGFRNTSFSIGGGMERRTANLSPRLAPPRGREWENPGLALIGKVDYEFPLGYPDLPLASVIYIQRFRLGVFGDFGFSGSADALSVGGQLNPEWSAGATLTMDFAAFNNFSGLSIGVEFAWLWQEERAVVSFMVMELPVF